MNYPVLRSVGRALPANYYPQEILSTALWNEWSGKVEDRALFERLHRSVGVRGRHLALPMDDYRELDSFGKCNDKWVERAADLGEEAAISALDRADLSPADVDHVFFTTVTGIASPSVDAKLVNRLSMRADIKRTPIFGLGCVGGAAGLARAADYVRAFPGHTAMLVAVELCSLTLQLKDRSVANIIASGLFADGAAAVIVNGADKEPGARQPRVVASRSMFFHDTEQMMGWHVGDNGFEIVLSPGVPISCAAGCGSAPIHSSTIAVSRAATSSIGSLTPAARRCCWRWKKRSKSHDAASNDRGGRWRRSEIYPRRRCFSSPPISSNRIRDPLCRRRLSWSHLRRALTDGQSFLDR